MRSTLLPLALLIIPAAAQSPAVKDAKALRAFFAENCVKCHGVDGSAVGADGKKLKGQDLTDAKEMAGKKDEKLAKTILKGIFFGKAMPAFKDKLSEADARAMVTEVVRKAEKGKTIQP